MNLEKINKLKEALENAETVLVGAGAGLSTSAGLTYSGRRFHELFGDFEAKYGIRDMYSGRLKNTGRGGRGTFSTTAMSSRRSLSTKIC